MATRKGSAENEENEVSSEVFSIQQVEEDVSHDQDGKQDQVILTKIYEMSTKNGKITDFVRCAVTPEKMMEDLEEWTELLQQITKEIEEKMTLIDDLKHLRSEHHEEKKRMEIDKDLNLLQQNLLKLRKNKEGASLALLTMTKKHEEMITKTEKRSFHGSTGSEEKLKPTYRESGTSYDMPGTSSRVTIETSSSSEEKTMEVPPELCVTENPNLKVYRGISPYTTYEAESDTSDVSDNSKQSVKNPNRETRIVAVIPPRKQNQEQRDHEVPKTPVQTCVVPNTPVKKLHPSRSAKKLNSVKKEEQIPKIENTVRDQSDADNFEALTTVKDHASESRSKNIPGEPTLVKQTELINKREENYDTTDGRKLGKNSEDVSVQLVKLYNAEEDENDEASSTESFDDFYPMTTEDNHVIGDEFKENSAIVEDRYYSEQNDQCVAEDQRAAVPQDTEDIGFVNEQVDMGSEGNVGLRLMEEEVFVHNVLPPRAFIPIDDDVRAFNDHY